MKRLMCALFVAVLFISSIPVFTFSACAEAQPSQLRTVWENPFTLTTYHQNDEVNSTFYTFPKVIWNGSQYVDYILNTSDMSAGIGSVYLKVLPDHTVFHDPYQREETIKSETWIVEGFNTSSSTWQADNPVSDDVHYLVNSSGIYFDRTVTLFSGASLDEWYWLRISSNLKISIILHPSQSGEYRLDWILDGVSGTRARYLAETQNVTAQLVEDQSCSSIQFLSDNESKSLADWSDAVFFNRTSLKWETCFRQLELQKDASDDRCRARVSFGDISLTPEQSVILDPTVETINSTGPSDGYIYRWGHTYPPQGNSQVDASGYYLFVGQYMMPYYSYLYDVDRSYLSFDTSPIPAMAYNISATLRLMTGWTGSIDPMVNFNVQIWGGNQSVWNGNLTMQERIAQGFVSVFGSQPIYNNTLSADSWGAGTVQVAAWNTADYQQDGVYINLTIPPDQINRLSSTEFELSSSREKEETPPQMNHDELISFYSGDSQGKEPKLEVNYCLDTVTIGTPMLVKWFYRNAGTSKAAIVLFGGSVDAPAVEIRSIDLLRHLDDPGEKYLGRIMFLDALVANGFSVYTPSNSTPDCFDEHYHTYCHTYYENDSRWVQDLTMYLMYNQTYSQVYLFGVSGGAVVVGNEIQKDYATRFSAAVMSCAPVDWDNLTGTIYHTARTASMAKVATFFPENLKDDYDFYNETQRYFGNEAVQKEWMDWNGGHADMFYDCSVSGENCSEAVINWFNAVHPPSTPFTPTGGQTVYVAGSYSYSTGTVDPNGDNVTYQFDWGDGTNTNTSLYTSGTNVSQSHTWNLMGTRQVKVRALDIHGNPSTWSQPLEVTVDCTMKTLTEGNFYTPRNTTRMQIRQLFNDSRFEGDQIGANSSRDPDGHVTMADIVFVNDHFGKSENQTGWDYMADVYPNKKTDMGDYSYGLGNFGFTGTYPPLNLTDVKIITNTNQTLYPDPGGYITMPWNVVSFTVYKNNQTTGAYIQFFPA